MAQTLTELFRQARLLASNRKSYTHHFSELGVAGVEYYGMLLTKKDSDHRQGRDKWTATIYMLRQQPSEAVSFQGHGATEKDAIDDMEGFALAWQERQQEQA